MTQVKYRYCPYCANPLSLIPVDREPKKHCGRCGITFFRKTAIGAAAVIFNTHGEVLMGVRAVEPERGKLDLIGGFVDLETLEHPRDALRREIGEELPYAQVDVGPILEIIHDEYGTNGGMTTNVGYLVKFLSGSIETASDVVSAVWVDPKTVDRSQLAFNNNGKFLDAFVQKTLWRS